jgi:transposase-like protein/IS1 family transposase
MKIRRSSSRCCLNPDCCFNRQFGKGNIIRHSFYTTTQGRRRRYRCKECGRTFSSTYGSPYYRLHKPRSLLDEVIPMGVHGIAISAMVRIKRMAWGTVARWLESATMYSEQFNSRMLKGFVIHELQADEISTFVGDKKQVVWVLTTLEVWSRLWISVVVGSRNFRNIKTGILDTIQRGRIEHRFLFTTDGFEMYEWAVKRLLACVCIYGQVIKKRRENRVIRADRRLLLGTKSELEEALFHSEDSSTLNTSFMERHNLTIRQGSEYLCRRTPCHARHSRYLIGQMALMMMYYNFVRPHMALKFDKMVRTPAMQAGLVTKRLSFREIFTAIFLFFFIAVTVRSYRLNFKQSWQDFRREWSKLNNTSLEKHQSFH